MSYQDFAFAGKNVTKTEDIGDGQITIHKLSPGLFQEIQKISVHSHAGGSSSQLNGEQAIGRFTLTADRVAKEAWAAWTPTLANLSGGTEDAVYLQIGNVVFFRWKYTLAGAGVGTNPSFTVPVTANSYYGTGVPSPFTAMAYDDNTGNGFPIIPFMTSTTVVRLGVHATGGTYSSIANVTATIPFTWAANDIITVSGSYEAA